jgi:hypothetical protein
MIGHPADDGRSDRRASECKVHAQRHHTPAHRGRVVALHQGDDRPAASILRPTDAKTAATRVGNGGSIVMMGSLVAGAGTTDS